MPGATTTSAPDLQPLDSGADGRHDPGRVATGCDRQGKAVPGDAAADPQVQVVHTCCLHAEDGLAGAGRGVGEFLQAQDRRRTVLGDPPGAHRHSFRSRLRWSRRGPDRTIQD